MADVDVLVIGAGLAGLTAARSLTAAGRTVVVLDKSTGPGGRLATRRIDGATLDHGAQFFTVRSDEFADLARRWQRSGAPIERWSDGFAQASDIRDGPSGVTETGGDGHARYVLRGGMNALAKALARDDLTVLTDARATAAWVRDGRWRVAVAGAGGPDVHDGAALVCTPPVPQGLALLARGGTVLPTSLAAALEAVSYDPCLALLAVLDTDPGLPAPGGVQFADGPVRWLADNARKPVSDRPAVTVHASAPWSTAWYDRAEADVAATLRGWLAPWLGDATVVAAQVKRWRYAQPRDLVDHRTLHGAVDGAAVGFAGDAFGHARIEGAARSGLAAAQALLAR
ncbi:MAG TPA: FAD-dependent oxidoreductase [Euzebyales bacterium]